MQEAINLKFLSIHLDETGRKIIASFTPEESTEAITPDVLKQAITEAGFGGYSLFEPVLQDATAKYNFGEAFEMPVGEALDGQVTIRIDTDRMAAYLTYTLPLGGTPAQMQDVLRETASKGITVELDQEAIAEALREGCDNVLIAKGRAPVNGTDGKIESFVPSLSTRTPHLDEHGLADFRELGDIVTVHTGDVLMRHILATSGEPGMTVTGQAIPAKAGKEVTFATKLNGTMLDPSDPNALIAAINGCPVMIRNDVSVEPVYTVKDVDLHIGNVTFDGAVHVTGDVHAGMAVHASGDIHIDGTAESAILDAGGDIVVKGGILGHEVQGDPSGFAIKCKGSCTARFVQNGQISAGNGIFIHEFAMQSELSAEHQIIVGEQGGRRGDIIGGVSRAGMLVKAHAIGSHSNMHTIIIAGADQALHERLTVATKAREAAEHKLGDIIKLLEVANANPGRVPPDTIKAALATRDASNAEIEALRAEETELQGHIDLARDARVVAEKHVFAGVEVRFGAKRYSVVADREGGAFHLKEGELVFE